jgi:hypothetical protein
MLALADQVTAAIYYNQMYFPCNQSLNVPPYGNGHASCRAKGTVADATARVDDINSWVYAICGPVYGAYINAQSSGDINHMLTSAYAYSYPSGDNYSDNACSPDFGCTYDSGFYGSC